MKFITILCNLEDRRIVLASQSPRRIELLQSVGLQFEIYPPRIPEGNLNISDPTDYARHNAREKAYWVSRHVDADLIVSADTVVTIHGQILEKPANRQQARRMLTTLSGETHQVITGLCLLGKNHEILDHEITAVRFYDLSNAEIDTYLSTDEPFDKAGAYGIQGFASLFIKAIEGCYFNVVGFPLGRFYQHLRRFPISE